MDRRHFLLTSLVAALALPSRARGSRRCRVPSRPARPRVYPRRQHRMIRLNVDLIIAVGSGAVRAAKAMSSRIPIVALDLESDPVASGWAASLSRPGGNVTGIFLDLPELNGKQFQFIKRLCRLVCSSRAKRLLGLFSMHTAAVTRRMRNSVAPLGTRYQLFFGSEPAPRRAGLVGARLVLRDEPPVAALDHLSATTSSTRARRSRSGRGRGRVGRRI
jgi:hypothetical protein